MLGWNIRLSYFWLRLHISKLLEFWLLLAWFVALVSSWVYFDVSCPQANMELIVVPLTYGLSFIVIWFIATSWFLLWRDPVGICLIFDSDNELGVCPWFRLVDFSFGFDALEWKFEGYNRFGEWMLTHLRYWFRWLGSSSPTSMMNS